MVNYLVLEGVEIERGPFRTRRAKPTHELGGLVVEHLIDMGNRPALAVVLHDVHGYSHEEIAEALRTSSEDVRSSILAGRQELHQRIFDSP